MKFIYFLIYIAIIKKYVLPSNFHNFLTKRRSIVWLRNQTFMLNPKNAYCSICCVDIRNQHKGRKCGIHTMCVYENKPVGASCKGLIVMEFSNDEIDAIVDIHNTLRNKIALGEELQGNPGPQPPAANMRIVSWDTELAKIASRWATQCLFSYDRCRDVIRFPVGQNLAKGSFASKSDLDYIADWYSFVEFVSKADITSYSFKDNDDLAQYTQLMWADTYLIGCARICFQKAVNGQVIYREHFFCNYGPAGNIPGQPVYRIGEACSFCLEGTGCNNPEYPGLCGNELLNESDFRKNRIESRSILKGSEPSKHRPYWVIYMVTTVTFCYFIFSEI